MTSLIYLFWFSLAAIVAGYILYPLFLWALLLTVRPKKTFQNHFPSLSIIVACHNEEQNIDDRITNIFASNYPMEKIEILIASDGSTDNTAAAVKKWQNWNVKVLDLTRRGRASTHNEAAKHATGEILVFTDAATVYDQNCLRYLAEPYADESVGAVSGVLIDHKLKHSSLGRSQGLYWRWEYFIRSAQSRLGVLSKTSGANMSLRRKLFQTIPPDVDIDQVAGPNVIKQGQMVVHAPKAIAYEEFATDLKRQLASRQRFTIQSFTSIKYHLFLLNVFRQPILSFHFIFYRLWRYLIPFFMILALLSNLILAAASWPFQVLLAIQVILYALAIIGYLVERRGHRVPLISTIFSLSYLELGIFLGVIKCLFGKTYSSYSKSE
ncbi:TPA: hypothetical protein DF272_03365 [Candidatus Falkowbacteria bacterium]|nr:hypothetical protein [Candidatus Falkowbacteria bacterium]